VVGAAGVFAALDGVAAAVGCVVAAAVGCVVAVAAAIGYAVPLPSSANQTPATP
jgi:hypothetical protein